MAHTQSGGQNDTAAPGATDNEAELQKESAGWRQRTLRPYRLGVIKPLYAEWLQFALDEAYERRVLNRPVELVMRAPLGSPMGDSMDVIDAFYDLVEHERVLGIFGPWDSDNAMALLPHIEKTGVPTFSICGSQQYVGHWAFNLSNGGMAEEPAVIVAWLKSKHYHRIGLIREATQIGEEYNTYFRRSCADGGLRIVSEGMIPVIATPEQVKEALSEISENNPDALVYLGFGVNGPLLNPALEALSWSPPRVMNTAFVAAPSSREAALALDGWVGVDQFDEENLVFGAVLNRFERRFAKRPKSSVASISYDLGHAAAIGLSRMRTASPQGLRDALETIRRLPACTGGPGTIITFGPMDHRGLKGPDFLILRRAHDGETSLEARAPVSPWEHPQSRG